MMKAFPDIRSLYPVSTDKRTDLTRHSQKSPGITDISQLPIALNATQVAAVLGISRAGADNLMRSRGFPTLFVGKRMVVPRDRLIAWMDANTGM